MDSGTSMEKYFPSLRRRQRTNRPKSPSEILSFNSKSSNSKPAKNVSEAFFNDVSKFRQITKLTSVSLLWLFGASRASRFDENLGKKITFSIFCFAHFRLSLTNDCDQLEILFQKQKSSGHKFLIDYRRFGKISKTRTFLNS